MRRAEARHALDIAEQVVEHVAPVADHVEDDAAALGLLVVPRRPLRRLPVALEHPVAELAAHAEDAAEEAGVDQHLELEQARQEQLVLHHAVLDLGLLRHADQIERVLQRVRHRLLAIDVLAGLHRLLQQLGAKLRGGGVEEQRVLLVLQRLVEIGGPARDAVRLGELLPPGRRCARPGSGRASPGRRSSAPRRPGRGSRRSSGSGAGSCPCAR